MALQTLNALARPAIPQLGNTVVVGAGQNTMAAGGEYHACNRTGMTIEYLQELAGGRVPVPVCPLSSATRSPVAVFHRKAGALPS